MKRYIMPLLTVISAMASNIIMSANWDGNTVNLSLLANLSEESRTARLRWNREEVDINSFSGKLSEIEPTVDSSSITLILPSDGFLDMNLSFTAFSDTVDFQLSTISGDMSKTHKPGDIAIFKDSIIITKDSSEPVSSKGFIEASPNPFNSKVEIRLPQPDQINIYSQSGRLIHSALPDGNTYPWDGTTNDGESIPSGIYYITTHSENAIGRVLYLK